MRVVHVSYSVKGGAGRSALRLHQNLRDLGKDSLIFAFDEGTTLPPSFPPGPVDRFLARYMMNIDKLPNKWHRSHVTASWSNNWAPNRTLRRVSELKPGIVHLHFIGAGTFPIKDFQLVQCPIVWTIHDMLAFTGGCHYTGGCERFLERCGSCPTLSSSSEDDLSRTNWMRKKDAWANVEFTLVSPSNWLADEARRSSIMADHKVMVIPYGIDLGCFNPMDRLEARKTLGLSSDKFVIAFGAASLTDPRKGLDLLWDALQNFNERAGKGNCELLVFGAGGWNPPGSWIPVRNVGMIDDDRKLALLYSAADVFCAPSREENLANTALESLGCGTPVLAFKIGGFPDIIDHRRTGYLAEPFDVASLADGLEFLYSSHVEGKDFRAACRDRAERLYDGKINANRYIELYNTLISSRADRSVASYVLR
jgi:glycosyltransferase involved in cell wall biosynthesis